MRAESLERRDQHPQDSRRRGGITIEDLDGFSGEVLEAVRIEIKWTERTEKAGRKGYE